MRRMSLRPGAVEGTTVSADAAARHLGVSDPFSVSVAAKVDDRFRGFADY
jgi:hypothetical protein